MSFSFTCSFSFTFSCYFSVFVLSNFSKIQTTSFSEPDQTNGPAIPISDHSSPSQSAPHEPHSLGSSLYRLFSRGNTDLRTAKDENLSNLAEIHSAVVDDVPVSAEEQYSARNYLLGATRATASYTYESANQWYALSKDMWWWLQKRVIKEHECQHPVPPRDSQMWVVLERNNSFWHLACTQWVILIDGMYCELLILIYTL